MAFATSMQPFLVERYYLHAKEHVGAQAYDATLAAFRRYVSRQGERAAQRALRDGQPLTFENYQYYREVVGTEEMRRTEKPHRNERSLTPEEYVCNTFECDIHDYLREVDAPPEVEEIFCRFVDAQECAGFNPSIRFIAETTLYGTDCCIHRVPKPTYTPDIRFGVRKEDAPPYAYIIASEYFLMRELFVACFGETGETIADLVREDFIARYSRETWDEVAAYAAADFNVYYPLGLR